MRSIAFGIILALGLAAPGSAAAQLSEAVIQPDIYDMVAAIAGPTAGAKIGGRSQSLEKIVTISRNAKGTPIVTSIQVAGPAKVPELPAGTLAVMIVHYKGQCSVPYGNDGAGVAEDVPVFVVSPSGKRIWQVQSSNGKRSMRLLKTFTERGSWEVVQPTLAQYRTYRCESYR